MSLWTHLGFQQNPYFATPIEVSKPGADLFVGRGHEVRRMINKWDEPNGCVTIIGGNIGTGKTSFLNVCQYLCFEGVRQFELPYDPPRLVPAFDKVQLESDADDRRLILQVLWSAARSVDRAFQERGLTPPALSAELVHWLGTTTAGYSATSGGGPTVAGRGLQGSGGGHSLPLREPGAVPLDSLAAKLADLAAEVANESVYRGLVVALDNIELIESARVVALLNQYRDTLFSTPRVWWVLIGQRGLFDLLDAESPRVTQRIKGTETTLDGLSWDDFHLAVSIRIENFRTRKDAVAPLGEDLLRILFDASAGEIRYVFKMADQIVSDALARDPHIRNVEPKMAEGILRDAVAEQLERLYLDVREKKVLKGMRERNSVRPKDFKEFGFQNAPNFLQGVLQPLQDKGLVSKSTQGNAALYSLRPLAILGARFNLLDAG